MKFRLITCLLLLINIVCYANNRCYSYDLTDSTKYQKVKHKLRKPITYHVIQTRENIKGYKPEFDNCSYTNRFTAAQRLKKYPFGISAKILAISYYGDPAKNPVILIDSLGLPMAKHDLDTVPGIIIINGRLKYDNVKQSKILTREEIEKFTDIIFNYGYSGMKNYPTTGFAKCFEPRNSIVFLDENDRVIDHLDICFHCHRSESKSRKIDEGIPCKQKYQMLQDFFISVGVPYGTTGKTYGMTND